MSEKGCGHHHHHHHHHHERRRLYRTLFILLGSLVVLTALVILIVFLVLQPKKPRFVLQDVTVYAFNASSSPSLLTTNVQVTVSSRNLNDRIGVLYENLHMFASYRNQQFTLATVLPDTYQPHNDAVVWSPFLYGNAVPVDPSLAASLDQDRVAGTVLLNLRIKGRVKWKVGTWISGRYELFVTCPAYISLGKQGSGIAFGPAMKFQVSQGCSVDVSSG